MNRPAPAIPLGTDGEPLYDLPSELSIDTDVARRVIGEFIRGQLQQAGFERAVLGLSGGIDSALVAYLVAEAIGADRLRCILMPYRTSSPASRGDAEVVVADLGCESEVVDISPMVDGFFGMDERPGASGPEGLAATALRRGNFAARMRMAVLYDRSVTWGGLVVGTGNKTESLIGYTTLFGDSACAFNPIGDLYKSQVRQLAAAIGVPEEVIRKAPSADLWPGQTDEIEAGFSYPNLDRLLFWRIDKRRSIEECVALGFEPAFVERVERLVATSEFKRQVPPVAKLGPRTAGVDYLYPRRRPGIGADLTPPMAGDTPGGTLYLVATPIGNLGDATFRSIEILKAVPLIAAEDTRITRRLLARYEIPTRLVSYHARSGPAREEELLVHLRAGADLALVTDAGTPAVSDPGMELAAAWGAEGGRVEAIPGASAVLVAVAASGIAGPRWAFEGFLPRRGRERLERLARLATDERGAVIFEAPNRLLGTLADLATACGGDRPAAVCRELTKLHEQVMRGTLGELGKAVDAGTIPARGEVVIIVGWWPGAGPSAAARPASKAAVETAREAQAAALAEVETLVAGGMGRSDAARRVAASSGIPRRRLYRVVPGG